MLQLSSVFEASDMRSFVENRHNHSESESRYTGLYSLYRLFSTVRLIYRKTEIFQAVAEFLRLVHTKKRHGIRKVKMSLRKLFLHTLIRRQHIFVQTFSVPFCKKLLHFLILHHCLYICFRKIQIVRNFLFNGFTDNGFQASLGLCH